MKLREDLFLVLVSIVTADGVVTSDERAGLLQAATAAGLDHAALGRIASAMDTQVAGAVPETLTLEERFFAYCAGCWLSAVDGVVSAEETAALALLGDRLKLDPNDRAIAAASAEAYSSDKRDVSALARIITAHQRL
jgi:tellurite resistance protein